MNQGYTVKSSIRGKTASWDALERLAVLRVNADSEGAFQMEKIRLTKREQDVYDYILEYRKEKRFSPSMREIAEGLGLHSASTVHVHIHHLIDKGWLLPCEQLNRTIIPAEEGL